MASESSNHGTSKANTNGVLPVTAAQTSGKTPVKAVSPKLKVLIRRLAPGLTEAEFTQYLGEEWAVGRGKVDWFSYQEGKESKDPSKPSYPSRAYLHLTQEGHLMTLVEAVRNVTFEDARNTWNSSCLIGPPSVEFAPYGRVPSGKSRNDAKQGTIDQDPDFMSFLESLANPVPEKEKEPVSESSTEESAKSEAITTTPLVQFLKDKKASKGKEVTPPKAGKPVTVKAITKPPKEPSPPREDSKNKGKDAKIERLVGKATKEAVKVLNREVVPKEATTSAPPASSTPVAVTQEPAAKTARAAARERGSIAAAARLIQRDLGLSPSNSHRKAKAEIAAADAKAAAGPTTGETSTSQSVQGSATPTGPRSGSTENSGRGRGMRGGAGAESRFSKSSGSKNNGRSNASATPAAAPAPAITLLKKPVVDAPAPSASTSVPVRAPTPAARTPTPASRAPTPASRAPTPASRAPTPAARTPTPAQTKSQGATSTPSTSSSSRQRNPPPQPTPSAGATRAFIKHANPSQGVTETLLKEALEAYGATSSVEIDKRKGFAYVEFVDPDGLVKAMKANPIKIANGTVQVLERKDRESQSGGGRVAKVGPSNADTPSATDTGGNGGGRRNGGRNGGGGGGGGRNRGRGRGGAAPATTSQAGQSSSTAAQPASAGAAGKEVAK